MYSIMMIDLYLYYAEFIGDNVDCWMEIQHGKGPWASLVNGIVPLGTTLTMVIGINDKQGTVSFCSLCSATISNIEW